MEDEGPKSELLWLLVFGWGVIGKIVEAEKPNRVSAKCAI
jgi:hypothetical protein